MGRAGGAVGRQRRMRFSVGSRRFRRSGGVGASLRRLFGDVPVRLATGTARVTAARRPGERRQAVHLRAMRPAIPLPFRVRETPGAEPSRPFAGRQAVHLRRLRHAVQVSKVLQETPAEPCAGAAAAGTGAPK